MSSEEEAMVAADVWKPFEEVMSDPLHWAAAWRARSGRKVIGHLLPDVPEEVIHAAGGLPLALEGAGIPISYAQAAIPGYTCSHAMGLLELGLRGALDGVDAMVIPYVCDTTRNLFHTWTHRFPQVPSEFLRLPKRLEHSGATRYLEAEFRRLARWVGEVTGKAPGEEDLVSSAELYNRSRWRLREAYRLHRQRPSIWTAERVGLLLASSLRVPREEHMAWMDSLPWDIDPVGRVDGRVPLYVRGKVWDPPGILGLLDQLGFLVVGDEMITGLRSVACDVATEGDPFRALAKRLVCAPLYPGYYVEPAHVVTGFMGRVRGSGAKGVLFLNPKFCEAAGFDLPDLSRALEQERIPSLVLETSTRGGSLGQIRVRLEAFREMLGDELP
jgi:benzoyl-CoA reductase/2-hydroxyglutaryl-CoA dehydratase subunit BcrC/BadD/HgdB